MGLLPPLNSLEGRTILFAAGILAFMEAVFVMAHFRKGPKTIKHPNYILALVTLVFLGYLWVSYGALRPSAPASIVTSIVLSVLFLAMLAAYLEVFTKVDLFVGRSRNFAMQLTFVGAAYLTFSALVYVGLVFLLKDIINPNAVVLTPEVYSLGAPTATFIVVLFHRMRKHLKSRAFEVLGDVATGILSFSFLVFFLKSVILISGGSITNDASLLSVDRLFYVGLVVTFGGLFVEGMYFLIQRNLKKHGTTVSLDRLYVTLGNQMLARDDKQSEIREFFPEPTVVHSEPSRASRLLMRLEQRLTFRIGRRVVKGSTIILILSLAVVGGLAYAVMPQASYTVTVSGYTINLSMIDSQQLTAADYPLSSESMDNVTVGRSYDIPIIHVTAGNFSWEAPTTERYVRLNSSSYSVQNTGKYLQVRVQQIRISTRVMASSLMPPNRNQTSNVAFAYRGMFKDAEIYYGLWKHGFHNVTRMCNDSVSGTMETILEDTYAQNDENKHVLIESRLSWGSTPGLDTTSVETLVAGLGDNVNFLITQSKVPTSVSVMASEPLVPFVIVGR